MSQPRSKRAARARRSAPNRRPWRLWQLLLLAPFLLHCGERTFGSGDYAFHVYLTWSRPEVATTATVNYHTQARFERSQVLWDVVSHAGEPGAYPNRVQGSVSDFPGTPRHVHHVELVGLAPDTVHYFVAGDPKSGFSREYRFRTLSETGESLRFIEGGDMGASEYSRTLLRWAARFDPHFVVLGGDISYANARFDIGLGIWDRWLRIWQDEMVDAEGNLIPLVAGIGNHEMSGVEIGSARDRAPVYLRLFKQGEGDVSFFARRFMGHTGLLVLDTEHLATHVEQSQWIFETLDRWSNGNVPNRFAVYHVGMYPSHRPVDSRKPTRARRHWLPHFDRFGLTAGFEHHDHAFKRTFPLTRDRLAEDPARGIVYLGDGAFGAGGMSPEAGRWYLEKSGPDMHFWQVEATRDGSRIEAVGLDGNPIDSFLRPPLR
jgi:hypothetical protein